MTPEEVRDLARREFLAGAGWGDATDAPLPGDASTRRYFRIRDGARTAMLMDQPQAAETPPCPTSATPAERVALGYNAVARLAGADCARFIAAADYLRSRGLSAPGILAADTRKGFVLLEDLGDGLYTDVLADDADEEALYAAAIDVLVRLHSTPKPDSLADGMALYAYDETALLAEADLMTEWFLPFALGRSARSEEVEAHRALWRKALAPLADSPKTFVHRDYHAQNLLWLPARSGVARVGVIDFQDAVAGSRSYDLVSLLEDARRDVAPALRERMMARYVGAMRAQGDALDADAFAAESAVIAAQRNAKIAGIFSRLAARDGKRRYLSYLPRVWENLERDLDHPLLRDLGDWYNRTIPREMRQARIIEGAGA
ncbi:MAG TPA: phosphotransferase [Rhizomicrobium sp.]